jgi:hypothetical protein
VAAGVSWGAAGLVDDAHGVGGDQAANDGATQDALKEHQCLALSLHTNRGRAELAAEALDQGGGDLPQLVVADARQEVSSPHLEVATARRRLEVRHGVAGPGQPPFLAYELRKRQAALQYPGGEWTELSPALDVELECLGVTLLRKRSGAL